MDITWKSSLHIAIPKKPQLPRPLPGLAWLHDHSIVEDNKVSPDHQLLSSPILWRWTPGIDKATGRYWHKLYPWELIHDGTDRSAVNRKTAPSKSPAIWESEWEWAEKSKSAFNCGCFASSRASKEGRAAVPLDNPLMHNNYNQSDQSDTNFVLSKSLSKLFIEFKLKQHTRVHTLVHQHTLQ